MLEYGLSLALISSALDEVCQDPGLLKTAATTDPAERELLEYLTLHGKELRKQATELFQAWYRGLEKRAAEHDLGANELIKQGALGLDLPWWAEIPATAGYFVPGLGTAMFGADAARHFYKMFGKGLNWKQRLAQGLYGGLNVGAAGLSLFGLGGLAKSPKLISLLGKLGKPGQFLAKKLPTAYRAISTPAAQYAHAAAGAAKPGIVGRAARLAGYSPHAKAGWMHKLMNRLRRFRGKPAKAYVRPYTRLGRTAQGRLGPGGAQFPWLRYEAAATPIGLLAGAGGGPAPAGRVAARAAPRTLPALRRWTAPVIRATPREYARWRA